MTKWKTHLERAIEIAGGQKALGDKIGKTQQYVWNLLNSATTIKAEVAIDIEVATSKAVKRGQLRPDIFGEVSDAA